MRPQDVFIQKMLEEKMSIIPNIQQQQQQRSFSAPTPFQLPQQQRSSQILVTLTILHSNSPHSFHP